MKRKKLQKLQKHLRTLKLFKVKNGNMSLPSGIDKTRFAIADYEFDCGMPACVAGHAKYIFDWQMEYESYFGKFQKFFNLSAKETDWITESESYKSLNPTPKTGAKHIQDVLDGKI